MLGGALLALAAASAAAIEQPRPEWDVVHCGFSRGVLWLTYTEAGQAHVVPAFPTEPVLKACARAGHPVAASAPVRTPLAMAPITVSPPAMPSPPAAAGRARSEPAITVQVLGGQITVDARNDGDVPLHCRVEFSWIAEGQTLAQSSSAPVQLAPRQAGRVASVNVPSGARLVGSPRWSCHP